MATNLNSPTTRRSGQTRPVVPGQHTGRNAVPPAAGRGPAAPVAPSLRGFGLPGPSHERHVVPAASLDALALPVGDDGIVAGIDVRQQPAVLGLFRPTPFEVLLVGGLWLSQVLTLRAAAVGARVAVETGRSQVWNPLAQAAGGGQPCVTVHDVGRLVPQGPSVTNPVLVVRDCGSRPPRRRLSDAPWQTTLTVLPFLGPTVGRLVAAAGLVGIQRVSPQEAEVLGRLLALPPQDVAALPSLGDNVTLWCVGRQREYVLTQPTDGEAGLLGAPRRMD
ncbi:hypothetical protein [Allostreptomyces psammosilenae]|uniref:Uncharacterized protein n=1 Tax=Allostreptomyces psammosilenae TaxID=1892865 RepID=A0A853ADQ0_9ACTN|nr:hypothetical protein [Allostreptomyces psammosilenae]NYI08452.1 hypothetical protein [Allostreptomyces psammosilenae]